MDYNDDNDDNEYIPSTPTGSTNDTTYDKNNDYNSNYDNELDHVKADEENSDLENLRLYAKNIIVRAWKRYLDRKTFQILKNSLNEIKKLCTNEILRKLNPRESVLFDDPLSRGKIRFRFGGETFPPYIYYKIYSSGQNIHYFSGYRILNSFSDAYHDAYKLMGNRNFEKVINKDNVWNNSCDIADPSDVTSKKEYIQYMNSLDKKPIYLGGRNNGWRELSTLSISLPLYEKEICNIYERNKSIYSSNSRNNKIACKKVSNSTSRKTNVDKQNINTKMKNERKKLKLVSKKKSNLQKQKERIKKMQKMYQQAKYEDQKNNEEYGNKNIENEEEELTDSEDDSSIYDLTDDSIEFNEDNINTEENVNIDDIENDDFRNIYEWASELSFENTFNDALTNMKI